MNANPETQHKYRTLAGWMLLAIVAGATLSSARADEPYARSRDYQLDDIRTHLWFDVSRREVRGEVTESVAALRDGIADLRFDSVSLQIQSVLVDGKEAKFSVTPKELIVSLAHPAERGEHHEVLIRYSGQPKKGLYFILPDNDYPEQPREIWTQGEAEDTRYYIPTYDYPNDRTTSEMVLTVPAKWITISNGQLVDVKDEGDGSKTWDWKQTEPLSTYLLSAVAGDFVERQDTWRGVPLRFVVPQGEQSKIEPTFARTKDMLDLFSNKLGVPYPWAQYAQTAVDDFVAGGMENTSATTLSTRDLVHPKLAAEMRIGDDTVLSHELAHQWFGDLVTCKDWANLWLNEGFATYFEHYWLEQRYGADEADYAFWRDRSRWFAQKRLFPVPLVTRDFDDADKYSGNIYGKAGWVMRMLRERLGDDNFFQGLHQYLVTYRGQNVVSADLQRAIEQSTSVNVDRFFQEWVYGAGAPQFQVEYSYDAAAKQVTLDVAQTQKAEGAVGLFDVPMEIEIATASGSRTYPVDVRQPSQSFHFPADGQPLMVIFDKGAKILKSVDFKEDPAMFVYQLAHAETVPDRADAAFALGAARNYPPAISALGDAALHDPFWGVRVESIRALGRIGGSDAEKQVIAALANDQPWVREVAARALGNFKDDSSLAARLTQLATDDPAYRVRASALRALADVKAPNAFDTLAAAAKSDSPDGILRDAALGAFGSLGDARAVPILTAWSASGKPLGSRQEAIAAIAEMDKKDTGITQMLLAYAHDPHFDVRTSAILALGARGDVSAIAPLEEMRRSGDATMAEGPHIDAALALLKAQTSPKN
ncbi:MAG TPA: M1 family aminopeptidase [Verrucomicrobiae bacterium]|nr:M1 family aminopeptidase [Verrucomicrobiae bacterium]